MSVWIGLLAVVVAAAVAFVVVLYVWPGLREPAGPESEGSTWGEFLVRAYRGREQADVIAAYVSDAGDLTARGYEPVAQSWGDGQWSGAFVLLTLILCLFAIGFLFLAYILAIRPDGTLLVTYRRVHA